MVKMCTVKFPSILVLLVLALALHQSTMVVNGGTRKFAEDQVLPELFPLLGLGGPVHHRLSNRFKAVASQQKLAFSEFSRHSSEDDEDFEDQIETSNGQPITELHHRNNQLHQVLSDSGSAAETHQVFLQSERYKMYGNSTDDEIVQIKKDAVINQLWGGECGADDWMRCHNVKSWGYLEYLEDGIRKNFTMECDTFHAVCMVNGWTVNRCHLLCMSRCNRELLFTNRYDNWVKHEGSCDPVSNRIPATG